MWKWLLLPALAALAYFAYSVASLPGSDGLPGGPGYISDEVWYVSAARNILHDFFKTPAESPYFTTTSNCLTNRSIVVKSYVNIQAYTVEGGINCYIRRGFPYPDKEGILAYYNLEHPPLVKYILAAAIAVKDWPLAWRIPSIAAALTTLVLVYLTARRYAGEVWALAAVYLMLFDSTFRALAGIAMLDIYLALFTALLVYFYVTGRVLGVGAALGLAASVKYSGAFPIFALTYLYSRRSLWKFVAVALMAVSVFLLVNLPIAAQLGLERWFREILAALSWHTTSRPPGPTASNPLDWLLMQNSFALYVNPDIYATGTPAYLVALGYAIYKRDDLSLIYLSTYGGYWLVYALGNHTLYSFYTAHFSPLAHILIARLLSELSS
ncbi:MAG: glycosyltransferase family 39 protein [Pyrobaculum sp.]